MLTELKTKSNYGLASETNKFLFLLTTERELEKKKQPINKKISKSNAERHVALPNEIFDYIHVAFCQRLFLLTWYEDMTYVVKEKFNNSKVLLELCCNKSRCRSLELEFINQTPYFKITFL